MTVRCILFLLVLLAVLPSEAAIVRGKVTNLQGEVIPFGTVLVLKTPYGSAIAEDGGYEIELPAGRNYILQFNCIGYKRKDIPVITQSAVLELNVELEPDDVFIEEVTVYAEKRDIAREVMRNAIDHRAEHRSRIEGLRFTLFQKLSLTEEVRPDAPGNDSSAVPERERPFVIEQRDLLESVSRVEWMYPSRFREVILAFDDGSYDVAWDDKSVSLSVEVGEVEITPDDDIYNDPYQLESDVAWLEWDFYQTSLDVQAVSDKRLLSPLAPTAMLNYRFDLEWIKTINGQKIYRILVTPLFPADGLFEGTIDIADGTWHIVELHLAVASASLLFHESFECSFEFVEVGEGAWIPLERKFDYTIREGRRRIFGQLSALYEDLELNPAFTENTFSREVRTYDDAAFERDSSWWVTNRRWGLDSLEQNHLHRMDSIRTWRTSEAYLLERDSVYNDLDIWDFLLTGIGYRDRSKGYSVLFDPLILQVNPVGIGGYRHRLNGQFALDLDNGMTLQTEGMIDYGFRNRDVRGKAGIGLTYLPKKFVRTFIRVGDYYDMINTYASIGSIFSRSNYVRTQTISVAQRMEIINGLFAELTFDFSDQKPITDLSLERWSGDLFGSVNNPVAFERYIKSEIRLDLNYTIRQKYMMKKGRKIVMGSKYPRLNLVYRKGIPGLFNSEVNFDYIEVGGRQDLELGRWGTSQWSLQAGSFINKRNLRILEHRYFRGSDRYFFSDPVRSFQLLGPTLSTADAYFRGNYIHHLNGVILHKIPLIRWLRLTEAGGGSFLSIPSRNFHHAELFAGLERVFRIREQLFRFGTYACIAKSNVAPVSFEIKFGLNFYDSYLRKWSY